MLKVKKFIQYSIIDTIDKGRANTEYIKIMKEMKISNRIVKLENWLISNDWSEETKKNVTQLHILDCPNSIKVKDFKEAKYSVIVKDNPDYEMIKEVSPSKVNKAISYLKWKRNKYRARELKVSYEEASDSLKIWNNSYRVQKSIDRFIIWKFSIKWEVYAEILFNSDLVILNGFGNRKKRKKLTCYSVY
jgi:hypothetical protein